MLCKFSKALFLIHDSLFFWFFMNLPDLTQAELDEKRVLMRVDFNVDYKKGVPQEKYKIESSKKSIDFVLSKPGVKLALLSHLGRPGNICDTLSFKSMGKELGKILEREIVFIEECVGKNVKKALDNLKDDQILLLENVRCFKEEIEGDEDFAKNLADNFDVYINESFGVSHRSHSSLVAVTKFLSSFVGFNVVKEVRDLSRLREGFERPALAIIGGVKIKTKVPIIKFLAEKYDKVLVGGKIGLEIENNHITFPDNVILPCGYVGDGLDIDQCTIDEFIVFIKEAKTIVWNGPLGQFEKEEYAVGTEKILKAIIENGAAYKVIGGGETVQFLEKKGLIEEFDFISTGGGAMMEFLVKGTLPALEVFQTKSKSNLN